MKKTILYILIILITALSGYFIYKSFLAYKGYQIVQKSEKYIIFVENLNTILQQIEQEHSSSAMYLGYQGKIDFTDLETIRERTDNTIDKTTLFIQNHPTFSPYLQNLEKLSENLQYVRSRVDVISSDYISILFDYYQDDISASFLNDIKNITEKLSLELDDLKEYLYAYKNFIEFRNNTNKEKSFISFILSASKKMDKEDLILWDDILKNAMIPSFDHLDNKTIKDIETILQPNNFSQLNFNMRVETAKGATSGNYSISVTQWLKSMDEKIKKVKLCEQIIYEYLRKNATGIISSPKEIIFNVSISLFLIFLLILLLIFSNKNQRNEKHFKDAKEKQKELDKIINHDKIINNNKITKQTINNVFGTDMSLSDTRAVQPAKSTALMDNKSQLETNEVEIFNIFEEFKYFKYFKDKTIKKNIEYNYYIDSTLPTSCIGDVTKIKQILAKLINHAIDFTPAYGSIKISIDKIAEKKTEYAIKFSVIDSGSYISKEQKLKIKKAFHKKNHTKIKNYNRIESDLTFAGKLILIMGGEIKIESEPKKGSSFSFTLALKKSSSTNVV